MSADFDKIRDDIYSIPGFAIEHPWVYLMLQAVLAIRWIYRIIVMFLKVAKALATTLFRLFIIYALYKLIF